MVKLSKAQKNYMVAKANYETVCQIEKECKTKVLTENVFFVSEEWEERGSRITDPIIDYLMNDARFRQYFRLCYEEYLKNGIAAEDYLTCPTYKPFQALLKAEKELIDWSYKGLRKLRSGEDTPQSWSHSRLNSITTSTLKSRLLTSQ
jgi:hypothetical protein